MESVPEQSGSYRADNINSDSAIAIGKTSLRQVFELAASANDGDIKPTELAEGRVVFDHLNYEVTIDGTKTKFTPQELRMLELLIINTHRWLSSEQII